MLPQIYGEMLNVQEKNVEHGMKGDVDIMGCKKGNKKTGKGKGGK